MIYRDMGNDKLATIRHSLAHLLAMAVLEIDPGAKLGIGPVIENGFYYDILSTKPLSNGQLPQLENKMRAFMKRNPAFIREEVPVEDGKRLFASQPFKIELINDLVSEKKVTEVSTYKTGAFLDLCQGPHVKTTNEIPLEGFKLTKLAGAYWRGSEKNQMLTRIYGVAFEKKDDLEKHLKMLDEAEKRDHRRLGKELDLFVFSDLVGGGLPLWTPKGTMVRNLLDDFVWELRHKCGYLKVEIPHITKKDLYEKSGHWDKIKNDLFKTAARKEHEFAVKPMNCPHHTQIYARKQWSYRELPQRYANTTMQYRDEQSGELAGLARVRSITLDDAHVFCRANQIKEEIAKIWEIVQEFYGAFGFLLQLRLSLHDPEHSENYLGDKKLWKTGEEILRKIAKGHKTPYFDAIGEAAFY